MRSLTLDVKVWEPTILDLFRNLGNAYCNGVWEGLLQLDHDWYHLSRKILNALKHYQEVKCVQHRLLYHASWCIFFFFCSEKGSTNKLELITKPSSKDSFALKEKYIQVKVSHSALKVLLTSSY